MSRECDFCEEDDIAPEKYPKHLQEECPKAGKVGQARLADHDDAQEVLLDA